MNAITYPQLNSVSLELDNLNRLALDELVEQNPVHATELEIFRRDTFVPKVLRWYRMNDELDWIWSKPAGYSGDYHTI
jgi:hypothetical protein